MGTNGVEAEQGTAQHTQMRLPSIIQHRPVRPIRPLYVFSVSAFSLMQVDINFQWKKKKLRLEWGGDNVSPFVCPRAFLRNFRPPFHDDNKSIVLLRI